jgi:hypothetical protein
MKGNIAVVDLLTTVTSLTKINIFLVDLIIQEMALKRGNITKGGVSYPGDYNQKNNNVTMDLLIQITILITVQHCPDGSAHPGDIKGHIKEVLHCLGLIFPSR